jgi:hypothetical protein
MTNPRPLLDQDAEFETEEGLGQDHFIREEGDDYE